MSLLFHYERTVTSRGDSSVHSWRRQSLNSSMLTLAQVQHTDVAETGLSAPGGAAAALLAEPGRTTTRSATRHEAGDVPQPKPDAKDTVLEGDRISSSVTGVHMMSPAGPLSKTVRFCTV